MIHLAVCECVKILLKKSESKENLYFIPEEIFASLESLSREGELLLLLNIIHEIFIYIWCLFLYQKNDASSSLLNHQGAHFFACMLLEVF